MSANQTAEGALNYGQAVTNAKGRIGIVTETVRKTGPNRGKVAVWWIGAAYEVSERPEDLTAATVRLA